MDLSCGETRVGDTNRDIIDKDYAEKDKNIVIIKKHKRKVESK